MPKKIYKLRDLMLGAVEGICSDEIALCVKSVVKTQIDKGDKCCCIWFGALTTQIAWKLKLTPSTTRFRLKKLLGDGYLIESKTAGGISRWWPVNLAGRLYITEPK